MAKKKKTRSGKGGWQGQILSLVGIVSAIVFLPTAILLLFGMIPTIVAAVVDKSKKGTKVLTVGAMNMAGCTPFLIELWTKEHTREYAMTLATDPRTVIVIYCAAATGYLIDWSLSGLVATMLVQRSHKRVENIRTEMEGLTKRWGREVTGELPLDQYGFPLEGDETAAAKGK